MDSEVLRHSRPESSCSSIAPGGKELLRQAIEGETENTWWRSAWRSSL